MNALIDSLQEKVGLTADQAKQAAEHMMEFIKSKIPASFHEHLDAAAIGNTIKLKGAEFLAEACDLRAANSYKTPRRKFPVLSQ